MSDEGRLAQRTPTPGHGKPHGPWGGGQVDPGPKLEGEKTPLPSGRAWIPLPQGMAAPQGTEAEQSPLSGSETAGRGKELLLPTPCHVPRKTPSITDPLRLLINCKWTPVLLRTVSQARTCSNSCDTRTGTEPLGEDWPAVPLTRLPTHQGWGHGGPASRGWGRPATEAPGPAPGPALQPPLCVGIL